MEPGAGVPYLRGLLHSRLLAARRRGGRRRGQPESDGRECRWQRNHRGRFPADLCGAAAGVPRDLRRQHQRADAAAARYRAADSAADDRRARGTDRSRASRPFCQRRGGARAHPVAARTAGERTLHRRAALSATAADAVAADDAGRVRGKSSPQPRRPEAQIGTHRLDDARRGRSRGRVSASQRESKA